MTPFLFERFHFDLHDLGCEILRLLSRIQHRRSKLRISTGKNPHALDPLGVANHLKFKMKTQTDLSMLWDGVKFHWGKVIEVTQKRNLPIAAHDSSL